MAASNNASAAKEITVFGRLSFPLFTAEQAFQNSQGSKFPAKSVGDAKPSFNLVLGQEQHDKLLNHIKTVFLPYVIEQGKANARDGLTEKDVAKLIKELDENFDDPSLNLPFREASEKTKDLDPEAISTMKVIGNAGVDIVQKAIVSSEDELVDMANPPSKFKAIVDMKDSVFDMYPGCNVGVTVNLYAYLNGKNPGFSAGGSTVVFRGDNDRFGGGTAVDADAMFMED